MLIDYLKKELLKRRKKNKSYSINAFANSLNVDSSTLAKILAGKRKLSFKLAKEITEALDIDDAVKNILLLTYSEANRKFHIEENYFVPDEEVSAALMSKWEYYAVLSYLEIKNVYEPESIAAAMGSDPETVNAIIDNLLKLEVIKLDQGLLNLTGKSLTAPPTFNRAALIRAHQEYIEKALNRLSSPDLSQHDYSGITLAMSSKKYKEATVRIRDFRRSLAEFLSGDEPAPDQVYRINIQLFPLIKKK